MAGIRRQIGQIWQANTWNNALVRPGDRMQITDLMERDGDKLISYVIVSGSRTGQTRTVLRSNLRGSQFDLISSEQPQEKPRVVICPHCQGRRIVMAMFSPPPSECDMCA